MNPSGSLITSRFRQLGFVVDDLDRAMTQWLAEGSGPFFVVRKPNGSGVSYRGKRLDLQFSVAFAQSGDTQIELLHQHDGAPSYYREAIPVGTSGLHHVGRLVDDFDAAMSRYAKRGVAVAGQNAPGDQRFTYFDTRAGLGAMTEIIEITPSILSFFDHIAAASVGWDGRDPLREL
jgi:catechol 2,3-dioxygenase-like lactoylglutathione lyase family enzyme